MNKYLIFFILFLTCCGGGGGPTSPTELDIPSANVSAKITNFYLHVDYVGEHSGIRFQATIENDGDIDIDRLTIRFHGTSCLPNANSLWDDLTMTEYDISLQVNEITTPPREGYISAWTYNKCYMGTPWQPDKIYPVEIEIIFNGIVLDSWIKYFDEHDQNVTIGPEDYV